MKRVLFLIGKFWEKRQISAHPVLFFVFFIFAILNNAAFFAVKRSILDFGRVEADSMILFGLKDLSFLAAGVVILPFIRGFGLKRVLRFVLGFMLASGLILLPFSESFSVTELLFIITGLCYGAVYVTTLASLPDFVKSKKKHARMIMNLEAAFSLGTFVSYLLFSFFIENTEVFWSRPLYFVIPLLAVTLFLHIGVREYRLTPDPDSDISKGSTRRFFRFSQRVFNLAGGALIWIFTLALSLAFFSDVHFESWVHTFDRQILHIEERQDLEIMALVLLCFSLSRFLCAFLLTYTNPFKLLIPCVTGGLILTHFTERVVEESDYITVTSLNELPPDILLIPATAFFLAPLIPLVIAALLTSVPADRQNVFLIFVVVFRYFSVRWAEDYSDYLYGAFTPYIAYYFNMISISLLFFVFYLFYHDMKDQKKVSGHTETT